MTKHTITKQKVIDTEAFKSLSPMMKILTKKFKNIQIIENGVNIANHKGFETLEKERNLSWSNILIVKELLNE